MDNEQQRDALDKLLEKKWLFLLVFGGLISFPVLVFSYVKVMQSDQGPAVFKAISGFFDIFL